MGETEGFGLKKAGKLWHEYHKKRSTAIIKMTMLLLHQKTALNPGICEASRLLFHAVA
jgi:hypothetical protein